VDHLLTVVVYVVKRPVLNRDIGVQIPSTVLKLLIMQTLGFILAWFSLFPGLFFTIAKLTGGGFGFKFFARFVGISITVLSIIYILKYWSFI
jgi:hypothetical protein